jgi:hypothetical protein
MKKRKYDIATARAEYKVKLDTKIADTYAELKLLYRNYFVLKERQVFATLTPSKYKCF